MTAFGERSASDYTAVIASDAKQSTPPQHEEWIASSLALLAMTKSAAHRKRVTTMIYGEARQKEGPPKRAFQKDG
jgi:hypothetical protein